MLRLFNMETGVVTGYGRILAAHPAMIEFDDSDPTALPRCEALRQARLRSLSGGSPFQEGFNTLDTALTKLRALYDVESTEQQSTLEAIGVTEVEESLAEAAAPPPKTRRGRRKAVVEHDNS